MKHPIIVKAREGGYTSPKTQKTTGKFDKADAMSRVFWKCLSKACGWKSTGLIRTCLCGKHGKVEIMEWNMHATMFHAINLDEGWAEAVEWLTNLINK